MLPLAPGCDEDSKRTLNPPPGPDYLANNSPDSVIANLALALGAMDAEGYAALLYDGIEPATDGLAYAPYKFYFDRGADPDLPELYLIERELACMGAMLSGEPGIDDGGNPVPGLHGFALDLAAHGAWAAPGDIAVDDDAYPVGTLWRSYDTAILITLKANYGENINAWSISDRLVAYCIPVEVGGETEWRLWKWYEIIGFKRGEQASAGVESASLGMIKVLYGS